MVGMVTDLLAPSSVTLAVFVNHFAGGANGAVKGLALAASSLGFISVSVGTIDAQLFDNTGAGTSLGEPLPCGVLGGASEYLDLHAAESGVLVIDTIGSRIDTVLSV